MKKEIKNIIFDYGGTLDTHGIHWSEMFWEAYQYFHLPVDKENFRKAFVYSERYIPNVIKHDFGLEKTYKTQIYYQFKYLESNNLLSGFSYLIHDKMVSHLVRQVKKNIEITKLTLEILEKDYTLGLISNYYGNVEKVLEELHILKHFKEVIDSTIVGVRKPHNEIFEIALNKLGAKANETIMVGDSYVNDITPAKLLGCKTIWLKGKGWSEVEDTSNADFIIQSLEQLQGVIKNIK